MPTLSTIFQKEPKDLSPDEKTELRRNIRKLTKDQEKKFFEILSQSDPNVGEDKLESEPAFDQKEQE